MPENNMKFQPMPKRFMVWDKRGRVWLKGRSGGLVLDLVDISAELKYNSNLPSDCQIVQSTNLFDAGTSEIFEGSIIRDEDEGYLSVVEYREGDFVGVDPCTGKVIDSLSAMARFSEVISHILSNPELVKEKNV